MIITYKVFLNYEISILRPVRMERKKVMMQDLAGAPGEEKVNSIYVFHISFPQALKYYQFLEALIGDLNIHCMFICR